MNFPKGNKITNLEPYQPSSPLVNETDYHQKIKGLRAADMEIPWKELSLKG